MSKIHIRLTLPTLPTVTALSLLSLILFFGSLHFGYLDGFFFASRKANMHGIDFFAIPRAFLNLIEQRSMFDTWGGEPYGPYATWFPFHPAFPLLVGSWLACLEPWTSYWVFAGVTVLLFACSAYTIASLAGDSLLSKGLIFACFYCSFLTYWLLYVGNMHGITVLSLSLIGAGFYQLAYSSHQGGAKKKIAAGVMIALLSKPVVFLIMPLLLVNKETRRLTVYCLLAYTLISLIFLFTPALNPESVELSEIIHAVLNPDYVKNNLNIYINNFKLNGLMKDNSIHWFHILAQSDYFWNHVSIFSLSAFMNSMTGHTLPGVVFKIPVLLIATLSFALLLVKADQPRLQCSLLLFIASIFSYFLGYNTVWEYQYTSVFPAVALLILLYNQESEHKRLFAAMLLCALFYYLPSPYFLVSHLPVNNTTMNITRSTRVVPTVIIYWMLIWLAGKKMYRAITQCR